MSGAQDILVIGGYGVVGRRVTARLASAFPGRVILGGRDEQKIEAVRAEIGEHCRGRRVDVSDPTSVVAALSGVGTLVTCVAQNNLDVIQVAIERGLAYTDIVPHLATWRSAERMSFEAKRTGARVLLGGGLVPGISNMMAANLAKQVERVEQVETAVLLGLGDEYGRDSLQYVLEAIPQPFTVQKQGHAEAAVSFAEGERVTFPEPVGERESYLFPWPDAACYPQTLGARTSLGRLALEPSWLGTLGAWLTRAGARKWLASPNRIQTLLHALDRTATAWAGRDVFALTVKVTSGDQVLSMSLVGHRQADATADSVCEFARALTANEIERPGVWLPEQIVPPEPFFARLAASGWLTRALAA